MLLTFLLLLAPPLRIPPRPKAPPPLPPLATGIDLVVKTAAGETRTSVQPNGKPDDPRPVATIKAGDKPQIRWQVRNTDSRKSTGSLVVHFLILKVPEAGKPIRAGLQRGDFADQVLGTEVAAKRTTTGNYNTALYQPGVYLVELELLEPEHGERRQYCAVDLKVE